MSIAALVKTLLDAGVDAATVVAAVAAVEADKPVDAQAERRREKDRERKRLRNSAESADSNDTPPSPQPPSSPCTPNTPLNPPSTPSAPATATATADEGWLRGLVGEEPVRIALDHATILGPLAAGEFTAADVAAGIASAVADPGFRPRYWRQLVGWIRRAAADRMAGKPKAATSVQMPRGERTDDQWRFHMQRWQATRVWMIHADCDEPDHLTTKVPAHILAEFGITERAA